MGWGGQESFWELCAAECNATDLLSMPWPRHKARCPGRKIKPDPVPGLNEVMIMTDMWKQRAPLCVINKLETLFNTHIPSSSHHFCLQRAPRAGGTTASRRQCDTDSQLLSLYSEPIFCWFLYTVWKWPKWGNQSYMQNQTHTHSQHHAKLTPHSWLSLVFERHREGSYSSNPGSRVLVLCQLWWWQAGSVGS